MGLSLEARSKLTGAIIEKKKTNNNNKTVFCFSRASILSFGSEIPRESKMQATVICNRQQHSLSEFMGGILKFLPDEDTKRL